MTSAILAESVSVLNCETDAMVSARSAESVSVLTFVTDVMAAILAESVSVLENVV